jgi:6-phosphogluconolactonase (cycloisomerase 2 family)
MKFTKFGKALLMSALSAGVVFSVTSCVQSYTVGYLYVTGTVTATPSGNGIISGFRIDHNTGQLDTIHGLPISSGGANPVRAVLLTGSRFLYVLNRGTTSSGGSDCTAADPCQNSNITQFAIGSNGILTPQETFYTQGLNPFRMIADPSGSYLFVLDHDSLYNGAPSSSANPNPNCAADLASATTCGDITAFSVNGTTGRLSLIQNAQGSAYLNATLTYFPIPSNPVDFVSAGGYIFTLYSATAQTSYPYTGGSQVFPYAFSSANLTTTNSPDSIGSVTQGTAIVNVGSYVFVLDNEAPNPNPTNAASQMLAFTVGTNGALLAGNPSVIPDDSIQSNPIYVVLENKGKWFYVANQSGVASSNSADGGIAGYIVNSPFQPTEISGLPVGFGVGGGAPQCLVEDPSNQFFYTANYDDSTVSGQTIDQNAGTLVPLSNSTKAPSQYSLTGPPTWCLVDGRTS